MEAPRAALAGRYRFLRGLQIGPKAVSWIATDQRTGHPVIVASLGAGRVAGLEGVVGVKHSHLAAILGMIHNPKPQELPNPAAPPSVHTLAVAEFASGASMHERLRGGPPTPAQAVAWLLKVVEALQSMHAIGGLHGAISPRSIVLDPDSPDFEAPILTQLMAAPSGPYCSPERLRGRGPSMADDVWAMHTTLYAALTGATPFGGTSREELVHSMLRVGARPLSDYGMLDATLEPIVARGLEPDPAKRETKLGSLEQKLRDWTRDHAQSRMARQPASDPPRPPEDDLSTDWDDDDAKTVVTNSAEIFEMARQAGRAITGARRVKEDDRVPTAPIETQPTAGSEDRVPTARIVPLAATPPSVVVNPSPITSDFEDATRVIDHEQAGSAPAIPPHRAAAPGFPPPAGAGGAAPPQPALDSASLDADIDALVPIKRRRGGRLLLVFVVLLLLGLAAYFTRKSWPAPVQRALKRTLHRF